MNADPVIAAVEQQLACYRRLAKLAQLQHEHVEHGQTEQLLDVLAKRQEVLDEVARLEAVIGPTRRDWAAFVALLAPEARARVESATAESRVLLEQITTADRNDALVLQQRKLNLGRQLNQATAARQVNRTYATSAYGKRPSRVDLSR